MDDPGRWVSLLGGTTGAVFAAWLILQFQRTVVGAQREEIADLRSEVRSLRAEVAQARAETVECERRYDRLVAGLADAGIALPRSEDMP